MGYSDPVNQRAYQLSWIRGRRLQWLNDNGPCATCGSWDDLQIDHKEPAEKGAYLKKYHNGNVWSWSAQRRNEELLKCQALCCKCHKEKHKSKHGTYQRYKRHKCRCDECRAGNAKRAAEYRKRRQAREPSYRKKIATGRSLAD